MKKVTAFLGLVFMTSTVFAQSFAHADCLAVKKIESSITIQQTRTRSESNSSRIVVIPRAIYKITATIQMEDGTELATSEMSAHWADPNQYDYNSSLRSLKAGLRYKNARCKNEEAIVALDKTLEEVSLNGFQTAIKVKSNEIADQVDGVRIPFNPKLYFSEGGVPVQPQH